MMSEEPVSFLASFPNIQTAIRVAGDGGARILLDIPETELPAIVRLLLLRGQVIRVTVQAEVQPGLTNGSTETKRRTARSPLDVAGG
jgi:hypothetical protein